MTTPANHQRLHLHQDPRFWDAMIGLAMILSGGLAVLAARALFLGSTSPLHIAILGLCGIGFCLIAYGSFVEPQRITIRKMALPIPGIKNLRVILVADLHVGPYKATAYLKRIVDHINDLQPDIVLIPGDFPYDHLSDISCLSELRNMQSTHGIFAVMGNHDTGRHLDFFTRHPIQTVDRSAEVTKALQSHGITVLHSESRIITLENGTSIAIAGVDDVWGAEANLQTTFQDIPKDIPTILLSHHPDVILQDACQRADLIVSGHTHGGQIRLPLIGALSPIPSKLGRKYDRGLFTVGEKTKLFITCGAGETMARARLFCPPEIVVMEA